MKASKNTRNMTGEHRSVRKKSDKYGPQNGICEQGKGKPG